MSPLRLAICAESSADEEAILVLARRLTRREVARWDLPTRAMRGHGDVFMLGEKVARRVAHSREVEALVLLVDNDGGRHCNLDHDRAARCGKCRRCRARTVIEQAGGLRAAAGVAVEAIETWALLAGGSATPQHQALGRNGSERRQLKRLVYGIETPSLELETRVLRERLDAADLELLAGQSASFRDFARALASLGSP